MHLHRPQRTRLGRLVETSGKRDDVFVRPEEVAGFEGVHGVRWTVQSAGGALAYRSACTAVTLD